MHGDKNFVLLMYFSSLCETEQNQNTLLLCPRKNCAKENDERILFDFWLKRLKLRNIQVYQILILMKLSISWKVSLKILVLQNRTHTSNSYFISILVFQNGISDQINSIANGFYPHIWKIGPCTTIYKLICLNVGEHLFGVCVCVCV